MSCYSVGTSEIMGFNMRYLDLKRKIRDVRMWAIQGIAEAGSGHPGASFSAAEIMGTLYFRKMRHDPSRPSWDDRDYFINSKAHSAPGFYSTLAMAGYFPPEELRTLRKLGSRLQGHPVRHSDRHWAADSLRRLHCVRHDGGGLLSVSLEAQFRRLQLAADRQQGRARSALLLRLLAHCDARPGHRGAR